MKRLVILLFIILAAASCTRVKITAANFPALFSDQIASYDIVYGDKIWQKLDVYKPANVNPKNPVIIFIYGGRWQYGSKSDYRFAADAFTSRGYVVVIPDYVKYPQGKYPQFIEDGAMAVAWTHENIWKYNGDVDKINVMGHSAGAYIGAMLTTDEEYLKHEGGSRKWIHAFAGLAGPYKLVPKPEYKEEFTGIFNDPKDYAPLCVPTYISPHMPPMLLLWGEADDKVEKYQMDDMASAIRKNGGVAETKTYPGIDHVGLVAALSLIKRSTAPVVYDVDAFFRGVK